MSQKTELVFIAKIPGYLPLNGTGFPEKKIIHRVDATEANVDTLLAAFEDFLKGAGYVFSGPLVIDASDD